MALAQSMGLFTTEDDASGEEVLHPQDLARSMWSTGQMHGVAVSGALARALERHLEVLGRGDLVPARYTVDLFRPALMEPCRVEVAVVREGPRVVLLDAVLAQDAGPVARAGCLFLVAGTTPEGRVWAPAERFAAPPADVVPPSDEPRVPFFASEAPWSQRFHEHQNAGRKQTWQTALPLVVGERPTPFQAVASIADGTSLVVNWGTAGVQHINTDITLALARRPEGIEIGLSATDRVEHAGIAVGTAEVFDRAGPLGTAMVTALANARRPVSFEDVEYDDDGTRRRR